MGASNFLENAIVDQWFRTRTVAKPTHLYIALTVAGVEVTGGAYARVQNDASDTNWTATQGGTSGNSSGSSGQTSNAVVLTFPAPTADWGLIDGCAVYDDPTAGNQIGTGTLVDTVLVRAGDAAPRFQVGALTVTVGG